jgi:hypothetical protein
MRIDFPEHPWLQLPISNARCHPSKTAIAYLGMSLSGAMLQCPRSKKLNSSIVRSDVFPGLWLAVPALLAGDMPTVLAVLQQGLDSPEHQAFGQSFARD